MVEDSPGVSFGKPRAFANGRSEIELSVDDHSQVGSCLLEFLLYVPKFDLFLASAWSGGCEVKQMELFGSEDNTVLEGPFVYFLESAVYALDDSWHALSMNP